MATSLRLTATSLRFSLHCVSALCVAPLKRPSEFGANILLTLLAFQVSVSREPQCQRNSDDSLVDLKLKRRSEGAPSTTVRIFMTSSGCSMEGALPKKERVPTVLGVAQF